MRRDKHCDVLFVVRVVHNDADTDADADADADNDVIYVDQDDADDDQDDANDDNDDNGRSKVADVPQVTYREIKAHMNVLANASDVFDAMFFGTGAQLAVEKNAEGQVLINLDDVDPDALNFAMDFVYKIDTAFKITEANFEEVCYVADKYNIGLLREECENFGSESVTLLNSISFLSCAYKFGFVELRRTARNVAAADLSTALASGRSTLLNVEAAVAFLFHFNLSLADCQLVVSAAISWAIDNVETAEGTISTEAVRAVLQPLVKVLRKYTKKHLPYFQSGWYTRFLPPKVFDIRYTPKQAVLNVKKQFQNADNSMIIYFSLNKSASLISIRGPDPELTAYCYEVHLEDDLWDVVKQLPNPFSCTKNVKYGIFFGPEESYTNITVGNLHCQINSGSPAQCLCRRTLSNGKQQGLRYDLNDGLIASVYGSTIDTFLVFHLD